MSGRNVAIGDFMGRSPPTARRARKCIVPANAVACDGTWGAKLAMEFDYIVVGTGSAGSVVAARLGELRDAKILVLEAGGKDFDPWIHIPVGFVKTLNSKRVNWGFEIAPEAYTGERTMLLARGKVLGGSSSINGMLYVRGNARDYDDWAQMGNQGWSYEDVLPYFKKTERRKEGADAYRGGEGPLAIAEFPERYELMDAVLRAGEELGYPPNPDYNGERQEGFAYYQVTQKNGVRHSAYRAFLKPALKRGNIELVTNAMALRVVLAEGRASAVVFERGGAIEIATARREVIVCAGAVQSPQLLELSGIGDPARLSAIGITPKHELAGVGENYIDHYMVRPSWRINRPITLNEVRRPLPLLKEALRYAFARKGLLTVPTALIAGFVKSRPELEAPDVQFHIAHASYGDPILRDFENQPGLTIGVYQTRPESKGSMHIASPDPRTQPVIVGNYLSLDYDRQVTVAGIRLARAVMETVAMRGYVDHEVTPGPEVRSDDEILDYCRRVGTAVYHPVGTCKMGSDPMAVVDDQLRVRGLDGLRVIDASVMPTITNGNTHAPTMMIAERGADLIKAAARGG